MNGKKVARFRNTMIIYCLSILLGIFSFKLSAQGTLLFLDDYEGDALNDDITGVFRTPTVGPSLSAAWYQAMGPLVVYPTAKVVNRLDGRAARVDVPQYCSLDYIEYLGASYGSKKFLISWDIAVSAVNGGWGMFLVRFPTSDPPDSMQVLFGFLDDGRVIRFSGKPAVDTLVPVGTFLADTRYSVRFVYDLVSKRYSADINGVRVVDHEPIPGHFALTSIDKFGFDLNQRINLPDIPPPQGNTYFVDNIRFATLESIFLPLMLRGN
jgi:hypothetical protein